MAALARGYSFVMYQAEAAATYSIPFPFLHTDDVRVFAGDTGDAVEQSVTWTGPTIIQLAHDVPRGLLVTIRRFTKRDDTLVVIHDGGQLPAKDLNLNNKQLLYIIQEQIDFGTYGGSGLPGGGSGWPGSGGTTDPNIQQIIDQLMQSPIMGLLVSRLDEIDDTAETLLDEILRSNAEFDYRREAKARVALVETSITTLQDSTHSLALRVDDVFAKYDDATSQIHTVEKAISDASSATASKFEGINARIGSAEADITTVKESVATESSARATAITQVSASVTAANARITSVSQAVADETGARTTAIQKSYTDFTAADGAVSSAINQNLATNYATKNFAQSIATTQVEAWAAGNYTILQQRFEALVKGSADPGGTPEWQANYTVRINGGTIGGVPVIAGIGLGVDSKTGSNFIVMADRFGIVSPTYTTVGGVQQMKYPFVVGTVGGVSTVGITGQLIVDGSVTADKIKVNTLSALTANMGEVNGGTFRTYQLDATGAIIDPLEFRAELTNKPGDAYPVWVGAGVKNWNNAVFAVDRAGNAKFAGTVSALNVTDQLQTQATCEWAGDIQGNYGGTTTPFTLPAPVRLGEKHIPVLLLEVAYSISDNDGASAASSDVILERLEGSTWTVVSKRTFSGQKFTSIPASIIYSGPSTSAATTYRVRVDGNGFNYFSVDFHLNAVRGYIFGMR